MSRHSVVVCDRCKKTDEDAETIQSSNHEYLYGDAKLQPTDLCADCFEDFKSWLEGPLVAPEPVCSCYVKSMDPSDHKSFCAIWINSVSAALR